MIAAASTETVRQAAEWIRAGRLVAFPTETVYGLGANALDPDAVRRIFEVKGRPTTSPLIVHVDSLDMARSLAGEWPEAAGALAERFWPGPLSLVLPKRDTVPDIVTAGLPTVGLRMPAHPLALDLIRAAGVPIAAPSANRFSQLSPTTAEHVRAGLGDAVGMVLDGGPTRVGIESTVLSLVLGRPLLLRPGTVTQEAIEALIGGITLVDTVPGAHPSPGLHPRHYSPRTPLYLVDAGEPLPAGSGALLWRIAESPAARSIRMPDDPDGYAARLYGALHELDRQGLDWIAVERPPSEPAWAAILDRLGRAATGRTAL